MTHAYDYSWAQIPAFSMAAVPGCVGVMRYLSGGAGFRNSKDASATEIANLHAANLACGFVWETSGTREKDGYAAGVADAEHANDEADWLGVPADVCIFYADDENPTNIDAEITYMQGVASVARRPWGEYGDGAVCVWALNNGGYAWKVETWGKDTDQHLTQLANTKEPLIPGIDASQYDTNIIHRPFPMWGPNGTTPGDDMTPEEVDARIEEYVFAKTNVGASRAELTVENYVFAPGANTPSRFGVAFLKAVTDFAGEIKKRLGL